MNSSPEQCNHCGAALAAQQAVPVLTDFGDRTSPPDGYWLCQPCAEAAQEAVEAARQAAEDAAYDHWADDQWVSHGPEDGAL